MLSHTLYIVDDDSFLVCFLYMLHSIAENSLTNNMADADEVQPLVCDNGTGMVKVRLTGNLLFVPILAEGGRSGNERDVKSHK
jgi:hypothetical protein